MQSEFQVYLQLGFEHILDLAGYDHILFIVALCAVYRLAEWRKVAILVTAFTIGHSLTLAIAAFDLVQVSSEWVEFLIPLTIVLTAIYNITFHQTDSPTTSTFSRQLSWNYLLALFFGLIHGLGFSNFFRSMLMPGEEGSFIWQLLSFNLGVEVGQLLLVAIILVLAYVAFNLLRIPQRIWTIGVSGLAAVPALLMLWERWPMG